MKYKGPRGVYFPFIKALLEDAGIKNIYINGYPQKNSMVPGCKINNPSICIYIYIYISKYVYDV